jgi:hypothetical protein
MGVRGQEAFVFAPRWRVWRFRWPMAFGLGHGSSERHSAFLTHAGTVAVLRTVCLRGQNFELRPIPSGFGYVRTRPRNPEILSGIVARERLSCFVFHGSMCVVAQTNSKPEPHGDQTMKNAKPKLSAEAAYENAHLVAQDLAERIKELLFDLPAPGCDEHPIHWGHVGDLNEINSRLSAVIAFMTGTER